MRKAIFASLLAGLLLVSNNLAAQTSACDVNLDGTVNVVDVQLVTNMTVGVTPCTVNIVGSGVCNADVVNRVITAALGGGCVTGSSHSVSLTWSPSSSSGVAGYNVYRSSTSGGSYTKINSSLVSGTNYTDSTVQSGQTYYYVTTAVNTSNAESAYSNQAVAVIPTP
jgi:fibronectin type 3 domain-containing protein